MICTMCGLSGSWLCPHHIYISADGWAAGNKVWCDFFHRRIVPKAIEKLPDDYWSYDGEGF